MVTPYSVLLFHPMKWQSEEHVGLHEAAEWARHFKQLETDMDRFLGELFGHAKSDIQQWITSHRYVSGPELAARGLAEMIDFKCSKCSTPAPATHNAARYFHSRNARNSRELECAKRAAKRK